MKRKRLLPFYLFVALVLLPAAVFAHGVEISDLTGQAGVRTLRFMYSDGEAMLFASVKVYPPSTPEATVQETMTDRDGYFSFVPFENGPWRLTVEDGMGHKGEIVIIVDDAAETMAAAQNAVPSGKLPRPFAILLGLSIILNIFAFYNFVLPLIKGSGKKKENTHAY
jgi:nickel transport protein